MYDFEHPQNYYEDYNPDTGDELILWRDGYPLQGRNLNNLQKMIIAARKSLGDALFKDGDIISDAQIAVDTSTGVCRASSGLVYLQGMVRSVPAAEFAVPMSGTVAVGIRLQERMVTELEDPSLRNPAVGSRGQAKPGAWRWRVKAVWAWDGDGGSGDFFPVHIIDDGMPRAKELPPNLDSVLQSLGRYDRESTDGGTYVVEGLTVRIAEDAVDGKQVYTVSEGKAHVYGQPVSLPTSRRITYNAVPDLRPVDTEVHTATGEERQRIEVAHAPIHRVTFLRVTVQKTVSVVHGAYSGVSDPLPDTSVVAIVKCRQGETVYAPGTDYKKTGDSVDWSPLGSEPAPGSTYEVTYNYLAGMEPAELDCDGFTVVGAVEGSSILVSYEQALPRLDRLVLTSEGTFTWLQGVGAERNWQQPKVPSKMLGLATVFQTWRPTRELTNDGVHVVSFNTMEELSSRVDYAISEIARQRLEADVATRENGTRAGIFVDPLLDDSMRDQGIEQSAAIVDNELTLPIEGRAFALSADVPKPTARAYTPRVILEQTLRTGSMQVNPYMSFEPMPAIVTLTPAIDRWTEVDSKFTSPVTQFLNTGHYVPGFWATRLVSQSVQTTQQVVGTETKLLEYLRPIDVAFRIEGFGPGEKLTSVTFDGIDVTPENPPVADADGVALGSFKIPDRVPAGSKRVECVGSPDGGSKGSAVFTGQGELTIQTIRQTNTVINYWTDPLAQTFVLNTDTQICAIDLWFTAKGGPARVQIREVDNGLPTHTILGEAVLPLSSIVVTGGGPTRVTFTNPVSVLGNIEYAIVILCDDATTSVAVAEMSKFDANAQRWVAAQPYTIGVLLSSSNASTWTAHQTMDLTFRLYEANYSSAAVHELDLGEATVPDSTDIMLLALADIPTAQTRMEYSLGLPDGQTLTVAEGQATRLSAPVAGAVNVRAKLVGDEKASPVLWPGSQLLAGAVRESADYYTRSIPAGGAKRAVLIYDALIPSGATVTPSLQVDGGEWRAMTPDGTLNQGDGVVEFRFADALGGAALIKARLVLTGNTKARPRVRNIRLMAIA